MLDYIRSKGGKAYVSSPYDSSISGTLFQQMNVTRIEPELRGHVDYLELHIYDLKNVVGALTGQLDVYSVMYSLFRSQIQTSLIYGRGSTPLGNLIIGEFGIWHGQGADQGVTYNFSESTRAAYYAAMYQAASDNGIENIFNHYFFDLADSEGNIINPPYGIVTLSGLFYESETAILDRFYSPASLTELFTSGGWSSQLTTTSTTYSVVSTGSSNSSSSQLLSVKPFLLLLLLAIGIAAVECNRLRWKGRKIV
jgi:hypothetical protein